MLVSPRSCEGSLTAPSTTASLGTRSVVNAPWSISGFRFVLAGMSCEATTTSLKDPPVTASSLTPFVYRITAADATMARTTAMATTRPRDLIALRSFP